MSLAQIVVGSGPAGVSAAKALLARGHTVWMLDGGATLEPERDRQRVELEKLPPAQWPGKASLWMRSGTKAAVKGLLKLTYGSDYPYRKMPGATPFQSDGVYVQYSMGKGGLSATWGTAVMPYRQKDMADWPLTANDLAPHYQSVLDFMPVAQARDGLADDFPLWKETKAMPLGPQGNQLWNTMHQHEHELQQAGIRFGRSRLAINQTGVGQAGPCTLCALCMYGCPRELLYSSAQTVDALRAHPNFRYLPGHVVKQVEERGDHVLVHAVLGDGSPEILTGKRAFLAAGVLASTAIVLRSQGAYDRKIEFKDSHYFMMPMLRLRGAPGFEMGNLQTMSQIFIEVMDEKLSPYATHMQVYTYSDLFEQPIRALLGPLAAIFPWKMFLSRMVLVQAFMHSKDSPSFYATLVKTPDGDELRLETEERPETTKLIGKLIGKLWSICGKTGMFPVRLLLQRGEPGRGFHTGGTFPMTGTPEGFQSDLLGRPTGMQRTHLVDSSVLPSIAGTTITYTVMANADRIASLVPAE